ISLEHGRAEPCLTTFQPGVSVLAGNELERREHTRRFSESLHPLQRTLGVVLHAERQSHRVTNARAADQLASNGDFEVTDLNRPSSFLLKGAEPAGRLIAPRPHKNSIVNYDNPNTCVAVLGSRANAENLRLAYRFDDLLRKRIRFHFSSTRQTFTLGSIGVSAFLFVLFRVISWICFWA